MEEDCLVALHLMIGRMSFVLMAKSLHSPLNLLFDETWKFHSALKIVSGKNMQIASLWCLWSTDSQRWGPKSREACDYSLLN